MTRASSNLNNHIGNNASSSGRDAMQDLLEALACCEDVQTRRDEQRDNLQAQLQAQLIMLLQRQPQAAPPPQRPLDPNDLYDKFKKRCSLEFTGTLDHTHADE